MHELSIAQSLIGLVESEAEKEGFARVLEIRLRMGEFSGIIPDCLREFFPLAAAGTKRPWRMKRDMLSPCPTTRWSDLLVVR